MVPWSNELNVPEETQIEQIMIKNGAIKIESISDKNVAPIPPTFNEISNEEIPRYLHTQTKAWKQFGFCQNDIDCRLHASTGSIAIAYLAIYRGK